MTVYRLSKDWQDEIQGVRKNWLTLGDDIADEAERQRWARHVTAITWQTVTTMRILRRLSRTS